MGKISYLDQVTINWSKLMRWILKTQKKTHNSLKNRNIRRRKAMIILRERKIMQAKATMTFKKMIPPRKMYKKLNKMEKMSNNKLIKLSFL